MSKEKTCEHCRYYKGLVDSLGECHKNPPFLHVDGIARRYGASDLPLTHSLWPRVLASDWCGEFSPE